jgi:outer membrane protein TolC
VGQAGTVLRQTEATIPQLEISLRQFQNQLCILLGIPPEDLLKKIAPGNIPEAPPEVVLGIPADLLRRRPDVREAERRAAAQCALIGVAESAFYPHISLIGTMDYTAERFKDLFNPNAFNGTFGPSFQWNILNYGRIWNNVRLQDAKFQELIAAYQNQVLTAQQDVENGLVTFLNAQKAEKLQRESVEFVNKAVKAVMGRYNTGIIDIIQVTQLQLLQVQADDLWAQAQGQIPTGLIQVYRALGGGWQIRLEDHAAPAGPPGPPPAERLTSPKVKPPGEMLPQPKVNPE